MLDICLWEPKPAHKYSHPSSFVGEAPSEGSDGSVREPVVG